MFQDRLVNDEDRQEFESILSDIMKSDFKVGFTSVISTRPVIYGDFMNLDIDPRPYQLVGDHSAVSSKYLIASVYFCT